MGQQLNMFTPEWSAVQNHWNPDDWHVSNREHYSPDKHLEDKYPGLRKNVHTKSEAEYFARLLNDESEFNLSLEDEFEYLDKHPYNDDCYHGA